MVGGRTGPRFTSHRSLVAFSLFGKRNHVAEELERITEDVPSRGRKGRESKETTISRPGLETRAASQPAPDGKDLGTKIMDFFAELGPIVSWVLQGVGPLCASRIGCPAILAPSSVSTGHLVTLSRRVLALLSWQRSLRTSGRSTRSGRARRSRGSLPSGA